MKDKRIEQKVIKGLIKRGYQPDDEVIKDIRKTIASEPIEKFRSDFILGLVCDYGFYLGLKDSPFSVPLQ